MTTPSGTRLHMLSTNRPSSSIMAAEDRFCQAKSNGTSDGPLPTHRVSRLSLVMT